MINTEFSHIRDGKWIEVPEIKKIAEQLVERYQYQSEQYDILKEENKLGFKRISKGFSVHNRALTKKFADNHQKMF